MSIIFNSYIPPVQTVICSLFIYFFFRTKPFSRSFFESVFIHFFQLSAVEEENQRLHSKIKHLEIELSLKLKQSLQHNGNTTLADTRSNMRAQVTSIPVDEKTGEVIPPRSPKHSPRRSAAPFSPTLSLLSSNGNSPSRRYSPVNNKNNNNNDSNNNSDELTEIKGIDSIADHAASRTIGETPSDVHKDAETVKSKTCSIM